MEKLDNIVMYSPKDVSKLLHLGNTKCLELFNSEEFPSIRIGRAFWIKADCLDKYLSEKHILANNDNEDLFWKVNLKNNYLQEHPYTSR